MKKNKKKIGDWYYIIYGLFVSCESVYFWKKRREALCRWGFHDWAMFGRNCKNTKCDRYFR